MESILNYLYGKYAPHALILYGSYADGTAGEGSDFDALILAEGEAKHDVNVVDGTQLDVWVYPVEYFVEDASLEEAVTILDGIVLHDPEGLGAALTARVQAYWAAKPGKTAEENAASLAWCRKMLTRTERADAEGFFRWHWLLVDSLEIACDLLHQPYRGPKKALRFLAENHPRVYAVYHQALTNLSQEALRAWIDCLEGLL